MRSTRRTFLGAASLGTAAFAVAGPAQAAPSRRIVLGMIGPGGMGTNHLKQLCGRKDATVAYVCDVDETRLGSAVKLVESTTGKSPKAVKDLRRVLDDGSVDAVFIATPDHWHAPASILALDAGKHVYVEKPCCHNIREGRLMAEAVKRSGKCLQVGTQSRSTPCVQEAMTRLRDARRPGFAIRSEQGADSRRPGGRWHGSPQIPGGSLGRASRSVTSWTLAAKSAT